MQTGPTTPGRVIITPGSAPGCRTAEQIAQAVQHRLAHDEPVTVTDVVTIATAPDDWTRSASQILHSIEVLLDPDEQAEVE